MSDVVCVGCCSFGIVLFELATGLRAYDAGRGYLRDYVEEQPVALLRDLKAGAELAHIYEPLMSVGATCSRPHAKDRPEMKKVPPSV